MSVQKLKYPSKEEILNYFKYDRDNGQFYYKEKKGNTQNIKMFNTRFSGELAESYRKRKNGILFPITCMNAQNYRTARLVWIVEYGSIDPDMQIDHIDGNPLNNRIDNLRLVTNVENAHNMTKRVDNRSGKTGVFLQDRGVWTAYIRHNYQRYHLGNYDTFEEAVEAREKAERDFKYHQNHGKDPNYVMG